MKRDNRTREQRKADASARIAWICFLLLGACLIVALITDADSAEETLAEPMKPATEEPFEGEDTPATEYSYLVESPLFYEITAEDRATLQCIVQGEAGGESLEGKMWVATCLLNAMRKDDMAAAEVRAAYQYAGWNENVSDETICAVSRVFDDGEITHDTVLWFYAPKLCNGSWHETQQFVAEIGGHKFFCPKET